MEHFALLTVIAVVISFVIGTVFNINIGLLCVVTGFLASIICGGTGVEIIRAISGSTIVLLVGILFMFTIANKNKTMEKLCTKLLLLVRGNRFLMPIMFALVGGIVCGAGAGGAMTSSLLCGPSAAMAKKAKIDPMLMAITAMHGTFALQFTPISALAVPILAYLASAGYPNLGGKILWWNFAIEFLAVIVALFIFGGRKLLKEKESFAIDLGKADTKFDLSNWVTLVSIIILIINILTIKLNMGFVALVLGMIMMLPSIKKGINDTAILKIIPWGTAVLLVGVMALIDVMSAAGGTKLIVDALHSLNIGNFSLLLLIAAAGLLSYYALSAPIILAILPLAIQLCQAMGNPHLIPGMCVAICVAATIVDVSPLSNNGALFLAQASALTENDSDTQKMFKTLLYYGAAQIVIGSLVCWFLFVILGL